MLKGHLTLSLKKIKDLLFFPPFWPLTFESGNHRAFAFVARSVFLAHLINPHRFPKPQQVFWGNLAREVIQCFLVRWTFKFHLFMLFFLSASTPIRQWLLVSRAGTRREKDGKTAVLNWQSFPSSLFLGYVTLARESFSMVAARSELRCLVEFYWHSNFLSDKHIFWFKSIIFIVTWYLIWFGFKLEKHRLLKDNDSNYILR